jgi:hypothetical protein
MNSSTIDTSLAKVPSLSKVPSISEVSSTSFKLKKTK